MEVPEDKEDKGGGSPRKRPTTLLEEPPKKLKDRVSFYEQVWSGTHSPVPESSGVVDVEEIERRIREEQQKRRQQEAAGSPVKIKLRSGTHSPVPEGSVDVEEIERRLREEQQRRRQQEAAGSPVKVKLRSHRSGDSSNSGSFEETFERVEEEGDLLGGGAKVVKFERITVHKSVREFTRPTTPGTSSEEAVSRTPSEEQILQDDSAYHTVSHSQPSANGYVSKSSSVTSLRFPSEESLLRRTPSREGLQHANPEWAAEGGGRPGSIEWYSEYRTQSFQNMAARLESVRSRSQYDSHIAEIKDEQERVQKKTFVNWINSYLSKRVPPLRVDDLIDDLKDGTKLLALLEVLSGEKLPVERGRNLKRPHFLSNANTALQFLQSKKIKLVNINSTDLVDGRPAVVLGLIWTIILYFQIEENTRALESLGHTFGGSASSLESLGARSADAADGKKKDDKRRTGARRALLQWVTNAIPK